MKRSVAWPDVLALLLPLAAAIAGGWNLVHNHNGNSPGTTSIALAVFYAAYAVGYVWWGAIARLYGAGPALAVTLFLLISTSIFLLSFVLGAFVLILFTLPSIGGIVASTIWATRGGVAVQRAAPGPEGTAAVQTSERWPEISDRLEIGALVLPALPVGALAIWLPGWLNAWGLFFGYIAYALAFTHFGLLAPPRHPHRTFVLGTLASALGLLIALTSPFGFVAVMFIAGPAAGAAVAGFVMIVSDGGDDIESVVRAERGM